MKYTWACPDPAMNERLVPIPHFATEAEERAFWESRDSSDYVDWSKAAKVVMPGLEPDRIQSTVPDVPDGHPQGRGKTTVT